jgi:hypothetical protein
MLVASLFALSLAAAPPHADAVAVAVFPLDDTSARDVAHRAIVAAVEGALPSQAAERGLVAKRFALVKPVDEDARKCGRDLAQERTVSCVRAQTKRLGATHAIVTSLHAHERGALEVALVTPTSIERARVAGIPAHVLAHAPRLSADLLERVAPRVDHQRAQALARLVKARKADDHEAAARICFELAALLPQEMATWTFDGADSLADAGRTAEASAIFSQLAFDESLDEDVRVEALARSRNPTGAITHDDGGAGGDGDAEARDDDASPTTDATNAVIVVGE